MNSFWNSWWITGQTHEKLASMLNWLYFREIATLEKLQLRFSFCPYICLYNWVQFRLFKYLETNLSLQWVSVPFNPLYTISIYWTSKFHFCHAFTERFTMFATPPPPLPLGSWHQKPWKSLMSLFSSQGRGRANRREGSPSIEAYYRHSMVENPWRELEEKYQERNKQD